jgi:hypothetical protein
MDRLRMVIVGKLGAGDRGLGRLESEAADRDEPNEQTRDALVEDLRVEGAADAEFAARLAAAVEAVRALAPPETAGVRAGDDGIAAGTLDIHADRGSIAAARIEGGATIHPPTPDPHQG